MTEEENKINISSIPIIEEFGNGQYVRYEDHQGHFIKRVYEDKNGMEIIIQSKWVKAHQDVEEGDICTIKTEGVLTDTPDKKRKVYNFELELLNGTIKTVTFNNNSLHNLIEGYGKDSKDWVNKQVIVQDIVKVQAFGKVMDSIIWNVSDGKTLADKINEA